MHCISYSNNVLHSVKITVPLLTNFLFRLVKHTMRRCMPIQIRVTSVMKIKKYNKVKQIAVLIKRYEVEHANNQFKRNYKKLNQLHDKSMDRL